MIASTAMPAEPERKVRARKNLTYLLLFAIVMFFMALSSAYVVSKGSADYWVSFRVPVEFYYSTAVIIISSITIQAALWLVGKGRARAASMWIGATLLLGVAFTFTQYAGWKDLFEHNFSVAGKMMWSKGTYGTDFTIARKGVTVEYVDGQYYLPTDTQHAKPLNAEMEDYQNTASAYFYVLTVGHWVHLAGGLLVLIVLAIKSFMGRYSTENHTGVWQGTMYWHFLAGLWIYLLSFIAFVH